MFRHPINYLYKHILTTEITASIFEDLWEFNTLFILKDEDSMSESTHNQSFEEGDNIGSPASSRASSPAPSPHLSTSLPAFSMPNSFIQHIKTEPTDSESPPQNKFHNNFFSNFFEQQFRESEAKPNLVQKPVPMFTPHHLPSFIREKLEAAAAGNLPMYPGFSPNFFQNPSFPHHHHLQKPEEGLDNYIHASSIEESEETKVVHNTGTSENIESN